MQGINPVAITARRWYARNGVPPPEPLRNGRAYCGLMSIDVVRAGSLCGLRIACVTGWCLSFPQQRTTSNEQLTGQTAGVGRAGSALGSGCISRR